MPALNPVLVPVPRSLWAALGAVVLLCLSACAPQVSRQEVARLASPDAKLDAVLLEVNTGATDTFRYDVFVLPHGATHLGKPVLSLVGATRNAQAFGANFRWQDPIHLRVEYLRARSVQGQPGRISVDGQPVQVDLAPGVTDPHAPPGGMAYSLRTAPMAGASR